MNKRKDRVIEKTILIVDDETEHLLSLERLFQKEGYSVSTASRGKEALDKMRSERFHVVLTDMIMPGEVDGLDILKTARTLQLESQIILMTAYGTIETAVEAMKSGAYDFITKPIRKVQVTKTVERAMEKMSLLEENRQLREQLEQVSGRAQIIGSSAAIRKPLKILEQAAPTTAPILIQGESGTGKELFARAIHRQSGRNKKNFVAVNCAALPETILESELFGYERGAFTGATQRKDGRIMAAHEGTLFLDEIGDMSLSLQAKLLRVLEEGEFERLGSTTSIKVDFRLIAATNRQLLQEVAEKRFREDLYYRLNGIPITLPPLRERKDDISLLTQHFVKRHCEENGVKTKGISHKTLDSLLAYKWPGNVRELEKKVQRAVILSAEDTLQPVDFFEEEAKPSATQAADFTVPFGLTLEEIEHQVIKETLARTGGDKKLTAQILGIAVRTIYRKIDQLN